MTVPNLAQGSCPAGIFLNSGSWLFWCHPVLQTASDFWSSWHTISNLEGLVFFCPVVCQALFRLLLVLGPEAFLGSGRLNHFETVLVVVWAKANRFQQHFWTFLVWVLASNQHTWACLWSLFESWVGSYLFVFSSEMSVRPVTETVSVWRRLILITNTPFVLFSLSGRDRACPTVQTSASCLLPRSFSG